MVKKCVFLGLLVLAVLASCSTAEFQPIVDSNRIPQLQYDHAVMSDGYKLPIDDRRTRSPKAQIIALHGFNDYHHAFNDLCQYMISHRTNCLSYDQRGFGVSEFKGLWPQEDAHQTDLLIMVDLVKKRSPNIPVYIVGESMGGAVIMASAKEKGPIADGIVLLAPAVWGRSTQPWYQNAALWLSYRLTPGWKPTGEGLNIVPTDNIEALRAMWYDPLVIKGARIDTLYGLTNLMDEAVDALDHILDENGLLMYGYKDQVIPKKPTCLAMAKLLKSSTWQVRLYEEGYHMLTRDLQRERVFYDIARWINKNSMNKVDTTQYC